MVTGIDRFREYFVAHEDQYAIIGGAACDLLFDSAGLDFRATRDIDMVLCVEVVDVGSRAHSRRSLMPADIEPASVAAGRRSSTGSTAPQTGAFPT